MLQKFRDTKAEASDFFPPIIRNEMNARCGIVRYAVRCHADGRQVRDQHLMLCLNIDISPRPQSYTKHSGCFRNF